MFKIFSIYISWINIKNVASGGSRCGTTYIYIYIYIYIYMSLGFKRLKKHRHDILGSFKKHEKFLSGWLTVCCRRSLPSGVIYGMQITRTPLQAGPSGRAV